MPKSPELLDIPELDEMPTAKPMGWITRILITLAASFGLWVASTAATRFWATKANASDVEQLKQAVQAKADGVTVTQMANDLHEIRVGQDRLESKIDSTNLRITQLKCGPAVANGCR